MAAILILKNLYFFPSISYNNITNAFSLIKRNEKLSPHFYVDFTLPPTRPFKLHLCIFHFSLDITKLKMLSEVFVYMKTYI